MSAGTLTPGGGMRAAGESETPEIRLPPGNPYALEGADAAGHREALGRCPDGDCEIPARDEDRPVPTFTPNPPPVALIRPYAAPAPKPRPVIFDQLAGALPAWDAPDAIAEPEAPGSLALLYAGPGWTRTLTASRLRSGEWDELPKIVEEGYGRNAAEMVTAYRHARERIIAGAETVCAAIGNPGLAGELLQRVRQLVDEAREAAAASGREAVR
jgi:hypothetical protein